MVLLESYITTMAEFHQIGLGAAHLEFIKHMHNCHSRTTAKQALA